MFLFDSFSEKIPAIKKGLYSLLFSLIWLLSPGSLSACDTSGFAINSYIDNGDGTFTINLTIMVAGDFTTDCGSTWGFFFNIDAPIISVSPPSLTSNNGTTLNGMVAGTMVTWGDPMGSFPTIPFVDAEAGSMTPDESFMVSITIGSQATIWNGGGQEANTCPNGGCGANQNEYGDDLPCFEPGITAIPPAPVCPGIPNPYSVVPNVYTDNVVWEPGGLMGNTVILAPTETTEYTVTASNDCGDFSITVIVEVMPFATIEAVNDNLESCEGLPVIMEVNPTNEDLVVWSPGGNVGNVLIETPTMSPTVYTATASNVCGEESVDITVTLIPGPSVEVITDSETLCDGDSIMLESEPMDADQVQWLPGGLNGESVTVTPDTTTEYIVLATSNCGVALDTVTIFVASSESMNIMLEACEGESVLYNGIPLAAGTTSTFTFENIAGCDSVVIVTVGELADVAVPLELSTCVGTTVAYEGEMLSPGDEMDFTFTAANGCDSVVSVSVVGLPNYTTPLPLSACQGTTIVYEGETLSPGDMMAFTFTAANGCDSVVNVTVAGLPVYDFDVMLQTCTGTTIPYLGMSLMPGSTTVFDLTAVNGCDSTVTVTVEELSVFTTAVGLEACTGSTILYNGTQLQPGTVTDFNFTTALGCDSVVTVTVTEVAIIEEEEEMSACAGESVLYQGTPVLAGTSMDFSFTTSQGCDSVVTLTVIELDNYALPLTLEACTNSSIMYNGVELFAGTVTDVALVASNGCDSVMTVTVDEVAEVTASLTLPACEGETKTFKGQQLAAGSVTDFTLVSSLGCDSILTVTVGESPIYDYPLLLQACTGATVIFNGVNLPPGTTVDFTLTTVDGCDSTIAVTVEEVETIFNDVGFETCANSFITYEGQQLPPGTETDFTFTSVNGCDSIVTVTVEESDMLGGDEELFACPGTTVVYEGQSLDPGTVTDFNFITAQGCDSVVTVTVTELESFASPLDLQACPGATAMYNGQLLAPGTVTDFTLTAINGCDSVVTVTVTELESFASPLALQACTGTTAAYNGQQLAAGTVTDFNFTAINGCDSVVTVTVEEVFVLTESLELSACSGETVLSNGQQLLAGTVTDFNFVSTQGCDSILTVTVIEEFPQTGVFQTEACTGELVMYNGQPLLAGSVTDITMMAANGCDSVVTVTVIELFSSTGSTTLQGCEGETLLYNGTEVTPGTSMDFTFANAAGCDSVVTVTALDPIPFVETSEVIEVCEGESAIIFGQSVSAAGVYSETYTALNGCDSIHSITLDVASDLVIGFDDNIAIGLGETVVLQPLVPSGVNLTYSWDADSTLSCFDCPNPVASPLNNTTYYLTVINGQDCQASADVLVVVRKKRDIYIPNSFSPNNDGINDLLIVFSGPNIVANISSFRVFSRWGEAIYEYRDFLPNNPTIGWNGTYRGEAMNPGVFVYMAEVEFVDGVKKLFKGEVTLVR